MTTPRRIQRRRTKGWRLTDATSNPNGAVTVTRPSRYGNPARIVPTGDRDGGFLVRWEPNGMPVGTWPADGMEARRYATDLYRSWINQPEQEHLRQAARSQLRGKDLACYCPLPTDGQPDHCHAAVLLELANQPTAA